jgi:hypothetical protein
VDDMRFCGHPVLGTGPYCPAHRGLAYVADPALFDADAMAEEIHRREARIVSTAAYQRGTNHENRS